MVDLDFNLTPKFWWVNISAPEEANEEEVSTWAWSLAGIEQLETIDAFQKKQQAAEDKVKANQLKELDYQEYEEREKKSPTTHGIVHERSIDQSWLMPNILTKEFSISARASTCNYRIMPHSNLNFFAS